MENSNILKIFAVIMALAIVAGCGGNADITSSTDLQASGAADVSTDFSDKEMVNIVLNGETNYAVIRAKDGTDTEKALATDLREKFEEVTGVSLKLRSDNKEAEEFEILVGNVNRSAVSELNLAENEYLVSNKNGTVIIYGGSDKALQKAYDYFVSQFLTAADGSKLDKVSVPVDFIYTGKYKSRDEQLMETALIEYPEYPEDVVPRDYDYTVKITQGDKTIEIPVYNAVFTSEYFNSSMDGDWHRRFCEFAFSGEPVTIEVAVNMDFSSYSVMPSSREISSQCNGNVITYTLDKPETTIIKINSDRDTLLAIFAEDPITDEEIPAKGAADVLYFEAGYHEIEGGHLNVQGGMTVYLEPGAVVAARVTLASDCTLIGRGAFIEPSPTRMPVQADNKRYFLTLNGSNVTVDGIKLLDSHDFNIITSGLTDSVIKNVKVLSNQISTDGFTTGGMCRNLEIYDCFWHISDNVFVIGGGGTEGFENVNVHDCIVASDYATFFPQESAIGPGEMTFKNIDILRCGSFLKITYNPSKRADGFGNFNLENIYAMDVDTEPRFIWVENFTSPASKTVNMKNVNFNKIKDTLEIATDIQGLIVNFDNVWIGGQLFTSSTNIKNTMDAKKNTFNFTSTKDAAAAMVGVNATKKVTAYTAEKIKIGAYKVGTKVQPYTENGITYVSAYEIVKELGFENVKLDEKTGNLTFNDGNKQYSFKAEGGNVLKNGRLMVPLSFFNEIGTSATYDKSKKTVTINNIARSGSLTYNGDFEDGLCREWTTRNFSQLYLSTEANSGKYAIRVEKGEKTTENGIYYDVANILRKNGRGTYKLTAYVKRVSGSDSTEIRIGVVTGFNFSAATTQKTFKLTDSWQKIECEFRASDIESLKNVGFFVGAADGSTIKYLIDDISFEKLG